MEKGMQVLLVEDDRMMADLVVEMLQATLPGAVVSHAATLAEVGPLLAADRQPDLILLDLNLPDSFGIDTVRAVHRQAPEVAIIVLTGLIDQELASQALQLGAQDYLIKGQLPLDLLERSVHYAIERKRFQRELQASQSFLLQSEKMASIGQLAAGVAHEINNPIGFISSNLGTMEKYLSRLEAYISELEGIIAKELPQADGAVDAARRTHKIEHIRDDAHSLLAESLDGVDRIRRIVQDLKSFSRTDLPESKESDLNVILERTINMVWNELKYKARVVRELGEMPPVRCFGQQLGQVFMNLLVNAAQAIEGQGTITVRSWAEADHAWVSISDTGCGIPPENLPRLFEPFFTTKDVGKGTGLGLSIAYDIVVKKHRGELQVASRPGNGTTFTVKIPILGGTDERND